jgi:hypothetical protein
MFCKNLHSFLIRKAPLVSSCQNFPEHFAFYNFARLYYHLLRYGTSCTIPTLISSICFYSSTCTVRPSFLVVIFLCAPSDGTRASRHSYLIVCLSRLAALPGHSSGYFPERLCFLWLKALFPFVFTIDILTKADIDNRT